MQEIINLSRNIYLCGEIDEETSKEVVQNLLEIESFDEENEGLIKDYEREPIIVYISTRGGYIEEALAIYDTIRMLSTPVVTVVLGFAYSAGLIISLAGDIRIISENGNIMYHQISYGDADTHMTMQRRINRCEIRHKDIQKIITTRSDLTLEKLKEYDERNEDLYFSAKEAVEVGICHMIQESCDLVDTEQLMKTLNEVEDLTDKKIEDINTI